MDCPSCGAPTVDVTETWHTFVEAEGAEYLAAYVTIRHCPSCGTVLGAGEDGTEWVLQPEDSRREG